MDLAVITGIFVWLICWMLDLFTIMAPPMGMIFLAIKVVFVIIGVVIVGKVLWSQHPILF